MWVTYVFMQYCVLLYHYCILCMYIYVLVVYLPYQLGRLTLSVLPLSLRVSGSNSIISHNHKILYVCMYYMYEYTRVALLIVFSLKLWTCSE